MKMKLRRTIVMFLVLAMMLSMAACSGSVQNVQDNNKPDTSKPDTSAPAGNDDSSEPSDTVGDSGSASFEVLANGITKTTMPWYRGEANVYQSESKGFVDKDPTTLTIGSAAQIIGCDPMNSQDEYPWSTNIYETLIYRNLQTGEPEPGLATEWYYDEDDNFHIILRENVKFHDGTYLDPDDVFFTLKRNADESSSNIHDACAKINFEESYVIDGNHMVLVFDSPASSFIAALQTGFAGILSKEFFDEHGEDYDFFEADAGCGPYMVVETTSGHSQLFKRFDEYWGEAPEFEFVKCVLYKDFTVGVIDYINGDLDMVLPINVYDSAMRFFNGEIDSTVCYQLPINRGTVLYVNTNEGPCADENVRLAIAYCIDYESLLYGVYQGTELGRRAQSVILDGSLYAITDGGYDYNPELAAEYLAKAGYDTNNRLKLTIETSDNVNNQAICEQVQYYCGQIGIDLECFFEKSAAMTKASTSVEYTYDLICYPMQYRSGHPSEGFANRDAWQKEPGTYSAIKGINNEELHYLLEEGSSCLDEARAEEIYHEVQYLFKEHAWTIPMLVGTGVCFIRDYISVKDGGFNSGYTCTWKNFGVAG